VNWPDGPTEHPLGDGRFAAIAERPESIDAIRATVAARVREGCAIYPQGGRTALDYGGIPARPGAVIDVSDLNRVVDYPAADMTITVEAGITLSALSAVLAEQGQRLPLDAPHADRATVGGIFATDTCGPRRYGAGRPRDQILGVSFASSDGKLVKGGGRVVKNVAGYDFPRLLTGSMGTLGVLAQLTLKVRPTPEFSVVSWVTFDRLADVAPVLDRLNVSRTRPMALDLLNSTALRRLRQSGTPAPDAGYALAVGFEGNAVAVAWQVDALASEVESARMTVARDQDAAASWHALVEFAGGDHGRLCVKASVRPSGVPELMARLDPGRWATQAHAGSGVVWAFRLDVDPTERLSDVLPEIDALRTIAVSQGGNLTVPRAPTAWKEIIPVWGTTRADWAVMERLKQALDPSRAMNPGRFVGTI
jgi:glycolate oxidase FAD binding subunit